MIDDVSGFGVGGQEDGTRNPPLCAALCHCTPGECGCEVFCNCHCNCDPMDVDGYELGYDTSANYLTDDMGFKALQGDWERLTIDVVIP